ncbi:MAG: hypothetical protein R3C53_08550 [Pirellulaceae bacterium]
MIIQSSSANRSVQETLLQCLHPQTGLILTVVKRISASSDSSSSTVKIEFETVEGQQVVKNSNEQFLVLTPVGEVALRPLGRLV